MPTSEKAPPYGIPSYWNTRFSTNTEPHDWLQSASILDAQITLALSTCPSSAPQILHIGGGTSELSFNLRTLVKDPRQVHNADFSGEAIAWGVKREKTFFGFEWDREFCDGAVEEGYVKPEDVRGLEMDMMRWTETNMLELASVIESCRIGSYDLVVDKTCCDAIACAGSKEVFFPYFLYLGSGKNAAKDTAVDLDDANMEMIHPLHILAIHLALVTRPGAKWIALSYSRNRFPFLESYTSELETEDYDYALPPELVARGLPNPSRLWTLLSKEMVHESHHWIYVLERSSEELKVRGT